VASSVASSVASTVASSVGSSVTASVGSIVASSVGAAASVTSTVSVGSGVGVGVVVRASIIAVAIMANCYITDGVSSCAIASGTAIIRHITINSRSFTRVDIKSYLLAGHMKYCVFYRARPARANVISCTMKQCSLSTAWTENWQVR